MKNNFLILEVGINHSGNFKRAKKITRLACSTKADAVKFQYFKADDLYRNNTKNYETANKYVLSLKDILELKKIVKKNKKKFICTAFSKEGYRSLNKIGVDAFKIASMDNNNYDLIEYVSKFKKKIVLSTGLASIKELNKTIKILNKSKCKFSLLHCISKYPSKIEDLNLINIRELSKKFKCEVGFSDHSIGIDALKESINFGATIFEKHFTDNKNRKNADNFISADIDDIKNFYEYYSYKKKISGKYIYSDHSSRPDKKFIKYYRRTIKTFFNNEVSYVRK